jgi:multiple sugar transport system substrate-binding protein
MVDQIELSGITWNHSRGFTPLAATAQRFQDEHPEVAITWQKRSLKEFGDFPIQRLVERFDILIVDHPFAGHAAAHPVLHPLDELLPPEFLADQAANSVGLSYLSYTSGEHLWALPVDAATPIAGWRPDVLERHDASTPATWEELLALAERGLVALPAAAVDCQMHLYMLILGLGVEPFQGPDEIAPAETLAVALEGLRELVAAAGLVNLERNPIRTWEALTRGGEAAYCPFAYGYANYGRADFTPHPLRFGGLVTLNGRRLRSTLGGTGLAISRRCTGAALEAAVAYAQEVASPACQTGLYTLSGGQPGHRAAWTDPTLNALTNGFFADTLPTLDEAYLRPRYDGYIPFQDQAGEVVRDYLREGGSLQPAIDRLNQLYRASRGAR